MFLLQQWQLGVCRFIRGSLISWSLEKKRGHTSGTDARHCPGVTRSQAREGAWLAHGHPAFRQQNRINLDLCGLFRTLVGILLGHLKVQANPKKGTRGGGLIGKSGLVAKTRR